MKKIFSVVTTLLVFSLSVSAISRVVQENASCTTCTPALYPTISAAVAASSAGDTIFVKNRAGDVPYLENVTITISLDIVPYTYDSMFYCQGNWTITPGAAGTIVDIIGMNNTVGYIKTGGAATGSPTRSVVRILDCVLNNGYVSFPYSNWDVQLYGTKIYNTSSGIQAVSIYHGTIIGDSIYQSTSTHLMTIGVDAVAGDTMCIIGNFLSLQDGANGYEVINWTSTSLFADIRNNYVTTNDYYGIYMTQQYSTTAYAPYNKIYNNTVVMTGSYSPNGPIYIAGGGAGSFTDVQNNLIARTVSYACYGVYNSGSGVVNSYYNWVDKYCSTGNSYNTYGNVGNNYALTNINAYMGTGTSLSYPISPISTSAPASGTTVALTSLGYYENNTFFTSVSTNNPVGAGNPGNLFYNLINVTTSNTPLSAPNTIGCYGGPFSIQNFFPMYSNASGSAFPRVYMTTSYLQSIVNGSGATWGFKATGFSR